jgi:hypothetical protein
MTFVWAVKSRQIWFTSLRARTNIICDACIRFLALYVPVGPKTVSNMFTPTQTNVQLYETLENCCPFSAFSIGFDHRFYIYLNIYWIMSMLFSHLKTYWNQLCELMMLLTRTHPYTGCILKKNKSKQAKTHFLTAKGPVQRCVYVYVSYSCKWMST